MEDEKYVKLIFEHGSIVFRKVTGYYFVRETQTCIVLFKKHKVSLDMIYMTGTLGKFIKYKDNLAETKVEVIDVNEEL